MCGRYTLKAEKEEMEKAFDAKVESADALPFRFNIAPTQFVPVVRHLEAENFLSAMKWGLIPSWAKDEKIGNKMINARAETIAEKPAFRSAFKSRRCIVPASGFYEWKKLERGKQPFYFHLKNKPVFGFAGLWEEWRDDETGEILETCTIITTEANEVLLPVHDRMPVILKAEDYDEWLDPKEANKERLQKLLAPYPAKEMSSHSVSRAVNSPTVDSPELILNSK
jgi:putative SOS response-associated peptidase YedK